MEYHALGRTGLQVGALGLGPEHVERQRATMEGILALDVEAGIDYVDLSTSTPRRPDLPGTGCP